jgi:hypothetical protein
VQWLAGFAPWLTYSAYFTVIVHEHRNLIPETCDQLRIFVNIFQRKYESQARAPMF